MQKKLAILSFLTLLFLLLLTGIWALFIKKDSVETTNDWVTITGDNITLTYRYAGVNVWKYNIKGQLPNPCQSAQVDALIAESYPEQVTIMVNIKESKSKDTACIQVIQELDISKEFNASEKATVTLQVNRQ